MARNSAAAQTAANQANAISDTSSNNAGALFSTLAPELESQLANPQGISPADMARIKTSDMQTAGGGEAGAVGQGALLAARTRNAGAPAAAIAKSSRQAGRQLSQADLDAELKNAEMKAAQQRSATSGLESLYGENLGSSVNALGQVASNVNANTNQENESWDWAKALLDPTLQDVTNIGIAKIKAAGGGLGT